MSSLKFNPNSIFSLMEMDNLFHDMDLSNFDFVISIDSLKVSVNRSFQYSVDMSFYCTINNQSYHKKYHYDIPKSKDNLVDWLMFYLDIHKDEEIKLMTLLDCV